MGPRKQAAPKPPLNPNRHSDFIPWTKTQPVNRKLPEVTPEQLNPKQRLVYDYVTSHLQSGIVGRLLAQGEGGTGKSFIISALRTYCMRRGIQFRTMAFTGAASFNVGGSTIHSELSIGLNFKKNIPEKNIDFVKSRLSNVKLIIIDEMSMVGIDLFGYIERRLRAIFNSDLPFGGVHVLMLGDFGQLPPVGSKMLFHRDPTAAGLVADGIRAYASFEHCIILEQVMRQGPEQIRFRELLGRLRSGELAPGDEELLASRSLANMTEEDLEPFMTSHHVFGDNRCVRAHNELEQMETSDNKIIVCDSVDSDPNSDGEALRICKGARIMITRNLNVPAGLCNGSTGKITEISKERCPEGFPKFVFVKMDRYFCKPFGLRSDIPFVPVVYPKYEKSLRKTIKRKQYPFVLSFSSSVHKIQGQTRDRIVVGLPPPWEAHSLFYKMSPQLFYVAISRSKTFKGVLLSQPFNKYVVVKHGIHLRLWKEECERLKGLEAATMDYMSRMI